MEAKKNKAIELFKNNYNCSQVVLNAYAKNLGLSDELSLKIATPFGGGMARQQYVCGAVTGAYLILGLKYGKHLKEDNESKSKTYEMVHQFNTEFLKENDSLQCKEILGFDMNTEEGKKEIESRNLYEVKCVKAIKTAIEIISKMI